MSYQRSWTLWVGALLVLSAGHARADEPATAPPPGTAVPATAPPGAAPPATAPPPGATAPPGAQHPYPYPYPHPYPYPYPYAYPGHPPRDVRPRELPYVEGEPAPPGYRLESRARRGAVITGAIVGGITYGVNLLIANVASAFSESDWRLTMMYVPGFGTWGYVPELCSEKQRGCSTVVLHSAAHTTGVILLVYGLTARKKRYLLQPGPVTLAPTLGTASAGLTLGGQF